VFGFLGGGPLPFAETYPGASFVLAFRAAAAGARGERLVGAAIPLAGAALDREELFARPGEDDGVRRRDRLSLAANVFVGMVEAPPGRQALYPNMSRSELFIS